MSIYHGSEWRLEPEKKNRTIKKIESFSTLPGGWHYGAGGPISEQTIDRGRRMIEHFMSLGFTRTDAFPGAYGELLLTAYNGPHYIGVTLEPDLTLSLNYEVAKSEIEYIETVDDLEIRRRLADIARTIWSTFDSSIHRDLTTIPASSMTWRLRSLPAEECRSSNWIVLNPSAA